MDLLRGPGLRQRTGMPEPPVTRLLTVERDGNPLRRYGHVSPHIGKVAPLDADALRRMADLAAYALPAEAPGTTRLIVGMAESALLLSWALAARLGGEAELRFTTREARGTPEGRPFLEPHSHGPVHALTLSPGRSYGSVVVVEDELTSGATLRNLLFAIHDVAGTCRVVTLSDRRPPRERELLQTQMARLGVDLSVTDLSRYDDGPPQRRSPGSNGGGRSFSVPPRWSLCANPFGRCPAVFEEAVDELWRRCRDLRPGTLYAVGECVDVAMVAWEALPGRERPLFRHVTRSPWVVDGVVVRDRLDLRGARVPDHFLYNEEVLPDRAVIVGESSTAPVARELSGLLASRGVGVETVEVARA